MDVSPFMVRLADGIGQSSTQAVWQIKRKRSSSCGANAARALQILISRHAPQVHIAKRARSIYKRRLVTHSNREAFA
jgi:hypothetical protein